MRDLVLIDLGRKSYAESLDLQRSLAERRAEGEGEDTLFVVEHDEVVTLGRAAQRSTRAIEAEVALARAAGVPIVEVERGGAATWHGPGQLVGYPIVKLEERERDVHAFLRALESSIGEALRETAGLEATGRSESAPTGIWIGDRKVGSLGIAVRRWVTLHGFALNLANDLTRFALIRPCDLEPSIMTSLEKLGALVERATLARAIHRSLARALGRRAKEGT